MKVCATLFTALLFLPATLHAQAGDAKNSGTVLVELFTSEGCSSCPPADALLRKLNGTRTPDGRLIVAISEHVTYWNSLGWADPFSAQAYTDRQNQYGDRFGLDSVYTPQMVVDGRAQFVGSDRASLDRALTARTGTRLQLDIASFQMTPDTLKLNVVAKDVPVGQAYDLVAVVVDDNDRSDVPRGENSGRTLVHANVARTLERVGSFKGPMATQWVEVKLPAAVKAHPAAGSHHVILFAQTPGLGAVVGSAKHAF